MFQLQSGGPNVNMSDEHATDQSDQPGGGEDQPLRNEENYSTNEVKLYPQRWWILASVSILQFANYGHWIAFGTVTKTSAVYYDQACLWDTLCKNNFRPIRTFL